MPGLWERFNDVPGGSGLNYYLGPAAKPISALAQFLPQMLPGADMVDMRANSAALMDYKGPMETIGDAGWLGLSTLGMALPGRPGALREPAEQGIRAYHGSPHDFDAFSMDKIGTGEGAQAYGHGLYFAESEGVAKSYRDNLGTWRSITDRLDADPLNRPLQGAKWLESGADTETLDKAYRALEPDSSQEMRDEWIRDAEAAWSDAQKSGRMYEVNINANPDDFLDWDKPLSEQSEKVRGALQFGSADAETDAAQKAYLDAMDAYQSRPENPDPQLTSMLEARVQDAYTAWEAARGNISKRGSQVYNDLASGEPYARGADRLREAGIPGIRYLDQGSRTAGDGSRNYVVFDDSLVSILRKYGMAGLLAGSGLALSAQEHQGGEY
jgi:hypothetical protein